MSLTRNRQHTQSQRTLISFAGILCSRLLGFMRDSLLAYVLGTSADIFLVAYRIPNTVRRLMAEGVLGMSHTAIVVTFFCMEEPSLRINEESSLYTRKETLLDTKEQEKNVYTEKKILSRGTCYEKGSFLQGLYFSFQVFLRILLWASLLSLFLALLAPVLMPFFAPGFSKESIDKASYYLQLCLPYIPLAMASAIVAATLNAAGRFMASSFASCVLNIGIIASLLPFLTAASTAVSFLDPAVWVCFGVVGGALLQLLFLLFDTYRLYRKKIQCPTATRKSTYEQSHTDCAVHAPSPLAKQKNTTAGILKPERFAPLDCSKLERFTTNTSQEAGSTTKTLEQDSIDQKAQQEAPNKSEQALLSRERDKKTASPYDVIKAMPWSILGGASQQINMIIAYITASFFASGSITALFFAERLMELPLTLAGATVATVALPNLALLLQKEKNEIFQKELGKTLLTTLFLIIPAAMGLAGIALPCVTLLFGHGNFDQHAVQVTSTGLRIFCVGLPGMCIARILTTAMTTLELSLQKQRTLSALAFFISAIVTACACFFFTRFYGLYGVFIAISLGAWTQALVLLVCLYMQGYTPKVSYKAMLRCVGYILLAYGMFLLLSLFPFPYNSKALLAFSLVCCVFGGSVVWLTLLRLLGCKEALYLLNGIFAPK